MNNEQERLASTKRHNWVDNALNTVKCTECNMITHWETMNLINSGGRVATLQAIGKQAADTLQLMKFKMTCPCGKRGSLIHFYRCFYCDIYFCKKCCPTHFKEMKR